jgi:hypothetical protein
LLETRQQIFLIDPKKGDTRTAWLRFTDALAVKKALVMEKVLMEGAAWPISS